MRLWIGLIALVFITACSEEQKVGWTAFVYPDRQNVPIGSGIQPYAIGTFDSFQECRSAAAKRMNDIWTRGGPVPAFECGYDCGAKSEYGGMFVCKQVKR